MPEILDPSMEEVDSKDLNTQTETISDNRLEVPQIDTKTGLSDDYLNEILPLTELFEPHNHPHPALAQRFYEEIKQQGITKYLDLFPPETYRNVINDKNRELISILNNKVDELTTAYIQIFEDENNKQEHINEFRRIGEEVTKLIKGE